MTERLISSCVMWCSFMCTLFSFIEPLVLNGIFIFAVLIAGYMDCRCLSTAAFFKEIDSFTGVTCTFTMVRFCVAN